MSSNKNSSNVIPLPINRRRTERLAIKDFLRIYGVIDDQQMTQMTLVDVSAEGCGLQLPSVSGKKFGQAPAELSIRLYFSNDTYLTIAFNVKNTRSQVENGVLYTIYGCSVDHSSPSFHVYMKFIEFLKVYSENAQKDVGDTKVSYL